MNSVGDRTSGSGTGKFKVIAIAASAGGLNALRQVLSPLPKGFAVPIAIVQHLDPKHPSHFPQLLNRWTALQVQEAAAGDFLQPGCAYIAPPDRHLLVNQDGTLSLTQTAQVRFSRPSADCLFESVAANYGKGSIAVVLTGTGKDGTAGVQMVKQAGGTIIVQDEASAEFSGMPQAAIQTGVVDFIVPLSDIAAKLISLAADEELK